MTRFLMVQGTSSDAGKSILVMALCRIFADKGIKVAPFKAQNMSSNSEIIEGLEIAKAQYLQARAARTKASVEMNPILLKPLGNYLSKVILLGREYSILHAKDYYERFVLNYGLKHVLNAIERLSKEYELIVIEGAGSPAEINLQEYDIANMRLAEILSASVIIVSDIDRGGSFASMIGTLELIPNKELVKGFVINKFRGDLEILRPAVERFEMVCNKPILGVIPYIDGIRLSNEDTLSLNNTKDANVIVIRYPNATNLTEIDPLLSTFKVSYINDNNLRDALLIILPPSRDLVADLKWMESNGIADWIRYASKKGFNIIGIDEGYAMLARSIDGTKGLGLLDLTLTNKRRVEKYALFNDKRCFIKIGFDVNDNREEALISKVDDKDLIIGNRRRNIIGYAASGIIEEVAKMLRLEVEDRVDEEIDRVANIIKENVDISKIEKIIGLDN
ncbi:MAG: cobyric acid synthase [Candidatus Nitrosocaldaceae archaeon]